MVPIRPSNPIIGVGFIVSTWVGYGSRHTSDASSFQWRFPLGFQIIPSVLLLVGLIWLPESPRYLIEKDRDDEGMKILRKLHYNGSNDEWIQTEYNEIRATLSAEKAITAPGWAVMFTVPQWRKRLLLGTLIQLFTQLTGISKYLIDVGTCLYHSSDRSPRRHRILPNHHVQRIGNRRPPRCSGRGNLQLRGTNRQPHLHLLHPRSCGP
jgi:MFS family permease